LDSLPLTPLGSGGVKTDETRSRLPSSPLIKMGTGVDEGLW